jgi:hypothetical protein
MEKLPKRLDRTYLVSMSDLGYNKCEICESLLNRKYNEAMATYHMPGVWLHHPCYMAADAAPKV